MEEILDEELFSFKEGYQVLYFYVTEMPFHQKMTTMLLKLQDVYDIEFNSIDVYLVKTMIKRFNLIDVPTVCIFKDGKEIRRIKGLVLTTAMRAVFRDVIEK